MAKKAKTSALLPFAIVPSFTSNGKPCLRVETELWIPDEDFPRFKQLVTQSGGFSFPKFVPEFGKKLTHVMGLDETSLMQILVLFAWIKKEPKAKKAKAPKATAEAPKVAEAPAPKAKKATKKAAKVAALADIKADGQPSDIVESITAQVLRGLKLAGAL